MRKITQTIVGTTPPLDKNVLWLDTTNSNSPVEKVFLNGAWIPTTVGDDYYTKDEVDDNFMSKIDDPHVGNILVMDENGKAVGSLAKPADFISNPEGGQEGEVLSVDNDGNPIWTTITPTGTADSAMSSTSTNAVQNKVIAKSYGYYKSQTASATQGISYINNFTNIKIKTGQKFHVKATGDAGISNNKNLNLFVNATTGTELGYITINGEDKSFVAEEDITTLVCFRYSAYVIASGTVTIELLIEGSVISEQLKPINNALANNAKNIDSLNERVEEIEEEIEGGTKTIPVSENSGHFYSYENVGSIVNSESDILAGDDGKYKAIDLSAYAGKILKFRIDSSASSSGRCTLLVSNNIVVYSNREADIRNQDIYLDIPENAILYESHATNSSISVSVITIGITEKIENVQDEIDVMKECYVASNGNDNNPGTLSLPFATISHAISAGYKSICVKAGIYNERINVEGIEGLSIYAYDNDSYDGNERKRPVITNGMVYNEFTSGTGYKSFVIGSTPQSYTKVFIDHTINPVIEYEGFPNTFNAGLWAKCSNKYNDFMFKPVLTLEELSENNTFFYDGTNVYFNTDAVIEGVVVVGDSESVAYFLNCNNLKLSGLDFGYAYTDGVSILASNLVNIENCSCHHSLRRNNWSYTRSDLRFTNCLSYKAKRDGFNAAWYGVVVLDNCKSVYNYDDGESSHEYCEIIVIGGEYAYNGKAGHAPVNGCKFSCTGTYSHDNFVNGLLRGGSGYSVLPYLISNSVFINNGTDIVTDIDINMMNCKYVTKTGTGTINDLTQ